MFGKAAGIIIPIVVAISTFGSANASVFGGARVIYVSARAQHIPYIFGNIHHYTQTPINALLFQAVLAIFMILIGSFENLVTFYSVIAWLFYGLACSALLVFRWREPNLKRPFRVFTLAIPIVFLFGVIFVLVFSIKTAPGEALASIGFICSGIPVWYIVVQDEGRRE